MINRIHTTCLFFHVVTSASAAVYSTMRTMNADLIGYPLIGDDAVSYAFGLKAFYNTNVKWVLQQQTLGSASFLQENSSSTAQHGLPNKSNFTSLAAFSPSSRRFLSIIFVLSAAALSSALTVQPMVPKGRAHRPLAQNGLSDDCFSVTADAKNKVQSNFPPCL